MPESRYWICPFCRMKTTRQLVEHLEAHLPARHEHVVARTGDEHFPQL